MIKKTFYKRMGAICIGFMLVFSTACTGDAKAQDVVHEKIKQVEVTQQEINLDESYIKGNVKIPLLTNMKNKKGQDQINYILKKDIMDFVDMQTSWAKEGETQTIIGSNYEVKYQEENIISILITKEINKGKENEYIFKSGYTIDLDTGKKIDFCMLFDEKENYEKAIKDYIEKNEKESYNITKEAIAGSQYYLKEGKIGIIFEHYMISSEEDAKLEFEIPFEAFQKGVNIDIHLKPYTVSMNTKNIKEDHPYIITDMDIPVISEMKDKKIESKINKMFEKEILDFKNEMIQRAKEESEEMKKYNDNIRPYGAYVNFEEKKNEGNLLSIYVIYYSYTGGAHGMHEDITYNIDLRTGEIINLKDLFKKGYDYQKIINEKIKQQIDQINKEERERLIKEGEDIKNLYKRYEEFVGIREEHPYYLKNGRIGIYFGLYEIASYAEGIPTFEIPLSELKEGMNEKYINEFF